MEVRIFDGVVSDLANVFSSTEKNKRYPQVTPSQQMRDISAAQKYCILKNNTDGTVDTLYVSPNGLLKSEYAGDLRLAANYEYDASAQQDPYSEYSTARQYIYKYIQGDNRVTTYRTNAIYLRYAEALNRAGYPQSAFLILKRGICEDYVKEHVDSIERTQAGTLIDFPATLFNKSLAIGIHALGSGEADCDSTYVLPMPDAATAASFTTRKDTVDYQIVEVENRIFNEMALECAFEGSRFDDLMRLAKRRGDNALLADPISRRSGTVDAALRARLMNESNWYLPLK
jgi:hypothetical protein